MSASIAALLRQGEYEQAYVKAVDIISADSSDADAWHSKGVIEAFRSDWIAAQTSLLQATSLNPRKAGWWRDIGVAFLGNEQYPEAIQPLRRSMELSSDSGTILYLAEALTAVNGSELDALPLIEMVRSKFAASTETEYKIGQIFERLHRWDDAVNAYHKSLELDTSNRQSCGRLTDLYLGLQFHEEAAHYARRLCRLTRYTSRSLHRLAITQFNLGRLRSSLRSHRRFLARYPLAAGVRSDFLFSLLHDPRQSTADLKAAHEEWFRVHGTARSNSAFLNTRDPNRRLRIGFPSGEFKETPTKYFLLPLLRAHDRSRLEIFCYHFAAARDAATADFQSVADHWRDSYRKTTEEIRSQILADQIDILVDISGHFAPHALDLFDRRAAPIQVALPMYPFTTGCRNIDFMLTDERITPNPQSEQQYSERFAKRIPSGYLTFDPMCGPVDVTPLPALARGYVTFGVFQRPAKCHDQFWKAASEILARRPGSRLVVHYSSSDLNLPGSLAKRLHLRALTRHGLSEDRVDFVGGRTPLEHLQILSSVDIALDTWPYSGQTTTCFCLWMGVPVVSLAGSIHASRTTLTVLHQLGLDDWVSESEQAYIETAVRKAQDIDELSLLRSSLRNRMAQAPICRPDLVARDIEIAYRQMWGEWCSQNEVERPELSA